MFVTVSVPVVRTYSVRLIADSEQEAINEVAMMTAGEVVELAFSSGEGGVILMDEVEVVESGSGDEE